MFGAISRAALLARKQIGARHMARDLELALHDTDIFGRQVTAFTQPVVDHRLALADQATESGLRPRFADRDGEA